MADVVTELDNGGIDTVRASIDINMEDWLFVENLVLLGEAFVGSGNALSNAIIGNDNTNTLNGFGGNDSLFGGGGNDRLFGDVQGALTLFRGDDFLDGGAGSDTMAGGFGNDTYVVDDAGDVVTEAIDAGNDTVQAWISYSIADQANLENIVLIGTGNTNATGNAGNNSLTGNAGVNVLTAGAGDDTLDGGAGADRLDGGDGNDTYVIDSVGDAIVDSSGVDTVTSFLADYTLGAGLENATAGGAGVVNLTGNTVANLLTGNANANILNGGAGVDTMSGGLGNDTYIVDNTLDVVNEGAGGGIDTVRVSINYSLAASSQVEFLISDTNASVRLSGSEFANTIVGGNGRDVLRGLGGDDVINGGRGRDELYGGAGKDFFKFDVRPTSSTVDRIKDFSTRDDTVMLNNSIFGKIGNGTDLNPGKLKSSYFRSGTTNEGLDSNDYVIFNTRTDTLLYDADGAGGRAAIAIAQFNNVTLTAGDILII
jgi:Ca2+-binding RTX toxin-like protein